MTDRRDFLKGLGASIASAGAILAGRRADAEPPPPEIVEVAWTEPELVLPEPEPLPTWDIETQGCPPFRLLQFAREVAEAVRADLTAEPLRVAPDLAHVELETEYPGPLSDWLVNHKLEVRLPGDIAVATVHVIEWELTGMDPHTLRLEGVLERFEMAE